MKFRAFPVLAGAYANQSLDGPFLTHACEVDAEGFAVRVLCKRVKFDHLVNDPGYSEAEPTCPTCTRALAKALKGGTQ